MYFNLPCVNFIRCPRAFRRMLTSADRFVLAAMLEGILLLVNMAAKTTFCLYLVKRLIVTLRCAVNVTTSSFQHFF